MIEVTANDRVGKKVRVKCNPDGMQLLNLFEMRLTSTFGLLHVDTIKILKLLIAAQTGTNAEKIVLKKSYNIYKVRVNGMMMMTIDCTSRKRSLRDLQLQIWPI